MSPTKKTAERELELLADWLHTLNPDAVKSLREAGSEFACAAAHEANTLEEVLKE